MQLFKQAKETMTEAGRTVSSVAIIAGAALVISLFAIVCALVVMRSA